MDDTLNIQAELAAAGKTGKDLQDATNSTTRLATLGEIDYQTAIKATLSIQQIFHKSTAETTSIIDYMNTIENQTSLSMKDFAAAIPIAAAPIKNLGGSIKDLGTLLVGMKVRGIDATEGANAIKSSFTRILNPVKAAQTMFKDFTGKDIKDLVKGTKGDLIPTLQALGAAMKNLSNLQRVQLSAKLFGTMQSTRLSAGVLSLTTDLADPNSQIAQAAQIAHASDASNAAVSAGELAVVKASASGKLKNAINSIKIQLAEMGQGFLSAGASIIDFSSKLLGLLNKIPGPIKKFGEIAIVTLAIIGPITMLAGLFGNFIGTIGKFGANIVLLATKFTLLDEKSGQELHQQVL
jgi:TP901 family phage tail tape measure protein